MPLLVLSADEAIKRVRHADSRWPRTPEAQAERLMPIAQPRFYPTFGINKDDLIFTAGSCFARNIEKQLVVEGYNVAVKQFEPPTDLGFKADSDAVLNRYVVSSIANEFRWAFGIKRFKTKAYIHLGEGKWFDPHIHPLVAPAPLEVVEQRRAAIARYMGLARQASVFIMTLGLAEAWYDRWTNYYLNGVLPTRARQIYPDRFELHLLDYNQIVGYLQYIYDVLKHHGRPDLKMLVTVSPVAMNTTFTGGEVLTANTYSKAVQRAAVEEFVRRNADVDYFPSYESVMLSDRRRAWRDDQAHASDELVRLNVLRMIEAYGAEASDEQGASSRATEAFNFVQRAREAIGLDAPEEAMAAYESALELTPDEGLILLEYGRFLADQRIFDRAAGLLEASTRHGSGPYGGYYFLAKVYVAAKQFQKAYGALVRARELQPNRPAVIELSVTLARRLNRLDEAIAFAEQQVTLEPHSEPARSRLEALRTQAETDAGARAAPLRLKRLGSS